MTRGDDTRHRIEVFTGAEGYRLGRGITPGYVMSLKAVYWNIHEPYHRMKVYETPQR